MTIKCLPATKCLRKQQCSCSLDQVIDAPPELVWSIVRQFHNPKSYRPFIRSCSLLSDATKAFHKITYITGFPARTSIERLDMLDDDARVLVFSLVGGDHGRRLVNYQGVISVCDEEDDGGDKKRTVVTEKYTVDVPEDSNEEDTRLFVNTLVGFNLKSLARVAEGVIG